MLALTDLESTGGFMYLSATLSSDLTHMNWLKITLIQNSGPGSHLGGSEKYKYTSTYRTRKHVQVW